MVAKRLRLNVSREWGGVSWATMRRWREFAGGSVRDELIAALRLKLELLRIMLRNLSWLRGVYGWGMDTYVSGLC